jgi:hypothetical protein
MQKCESSRDLMTSGGNCMKLTLVVSADCTKSER